MQSLSSGPLPQRTRIAFVQSCWHKDIVDRCREAFLIEMANWEIAETDIDLFEVSGAFEIPLQTKLLAKSGQYAAIVAAGLVVDGGIYRHEFVAHAVINALMQVQMETEIPVISAVLTPHHFHAHTDHNNFFFDHLALKGSEAAKACAQTIAQLRALRGNGGQRQLQTQREHSI
ncbi:MAG TPA: 6,7-dimethyl-8-ribityllumazine synthase [Spongiibacteraceae bacterium]|jgi:6,7-dimethyl-8-ribityllumazine synthase